MHDLHERGPDLVQTLIQSRDFMRGERKAFDDQLSLLPTHALSHSGVGQRAFVQPAERQLQATAPFDFIIHQRLALARWFKHSLPQEIVVIACQCQRAQIKATVRAKRCAVALTLQFAIDGEQKIRTADDLSHAFPLRQMTWAIRLLTSQRRDNQRHRHRIEGPSTSTN